MRVKNRYIDLHLPCRKCLPCLKRKARVWSHRATVETAAAFRTWFVTFTIRPENRLRFRLLASRQGDETFAGVHRAIGKEFTLFFKRVRKNTGQPLRYCLFAEKHKDGFPHYHALIHERGAAIPRRDIETEWVHGFTSFRLCDGSAGRYVTKYVTKDACARVRASIRYGLPALQEPPSRSEGAHHLGDRGVWPPVLKA